jgi:F-type H+-transporting ATPase subunit b
MLSHGMLLAWAAPVIAATNNLASNYLIWWLAQVVAVAFLVYLFLRWRPSFMGRRTIGETLGQALDAREAQIQTQLQAAERSREEAARIQAQSEQDIAQARHEAEDIVTRASQTSRAIQEEMRVRAREEYDRVVGQARVQIDYEREQAELALRRRAADVVIDAARQVVERHLQPKEDQQLIDDSLAKMRQGQ